MVRNQTSLEERLLSFEPDDDDDPIRPGDEVGNSGGGDVSEAALLAYSTVLANWLKTPSESLFDYVKAGALRHPGQQQAWMLSVMWCELDFNCFARNRYGIIEEVESRIDRLINQARKADEDGDASGSESATLQSLQHAEKYTRAKAELKHLESKSTRGMSAALIEELRKQRFIQINEMDAMRDLVNQLPAIARRAFFLKVYLVWVEETITEDEAAGIAVSQWDVTEVKKKLAKGAKAVEMAEQMIMSWRVGYNLYLTSLASGEQHRNAGLVAITNGNGFMPPESGDTKRWNQVLKSFRGQMTGSDGDRSRGRG